MADKQAKTEGLPFLYNEVVVLNTDTHSDLKLTPEPDYLFAKQTNAVPLMCSEFTLANTYYPIVFINDGAVVPTAVLGVRNQENLFVNDSGKWAENIYIPAYLRRYPFILARGQKDDLTDAALSVDSTSNTLNKENGDALVSDGKPTDVAKRAVDFCLAYAREGKDTEELCKALSAQDGLLIKRQLMISGELAKQISGGNDSYTLGDFLVIDEAKLKALPDDIVLDWHKKGWLQAAYAQIASVARWDLLVNRWSQQKSAEIQ